MPTAPKVEDPFGNTVQGKNQSRMPSGPNLPSFTGQWAKPSPTDFMIAAANMHEMGRLFAPDTSLDSVTKSSPPTDELTNLDRGRFDDGPTTKEWLRRKIDRERPDYRDLEASGRDIEKNRNNPRNKVDETGSLANIARKI